jgi:hypothetical protein
MVQQPPGGYQPPPPPPGYQAPPPPPPGMPPQAPMRPPVDMSSLPLGDLIAAGSALIFIIITGIGWYGDSGIHKMGAMGTLGMLLGILILVFAGVMIANHFLDFIPMELPSGLIYLGAEALVLLIMLLALVLKPSEGVWGYTFKWPVSWVTWVLALIFSFGIAVGGILNINKSK